MEEALSTIEFPVLDIDISDALNGIAGKFNGELTSAGGKDGTYCCTFSCDFWDLWGTEPEA